MDLTGLLSECGGFTLAILRHSDHTNVVVDTRLQSIDGVMTSRWHHQVLKDGHALTGCHHCDPVTSDGCGVERRPAETDSGVAHLLKAEVRQLWHFWIGGERVWGRGQKRQERNTKPEERQTDM